MKKCILLLLTICLLATCVACTNDQPTTSDTPTTTPSSATSAPTKAPTEAPTKAPTEAPTKAPTEAPTKAPTEAPTGPSLSDNWEDFTFELDGVVYQFPLTYQDFTDNKWRTSIDDDTIVSSEDTETAFLSRAFYSFLVDFVNPSSKDLPVSDCLAMSIFFDSTIDVTLAGGITPKSSKDEILAAWGDSCYIEDGGDHICYATEVDGFPAYVNFNYDDDGKLSINLWVDWIESKV